MRALSIGVLIAWRLKRSSRKEKGLANRCGESYRGCARKRRSKEHQRNLHLLSKNRQSTASAMPTDRSFPVGHTNRIFGGEP